MTEFKDMLKYYRKQAGLSQAALAAKIGVSPSTISMYEVGQRQPDFETEEMLADYFNVDLNTLRGKDTELLDQKHRDLLTNFDMLSETDQETILVLIEQFKRRK